MFNLDEYVIALSENFTAKEVGVHALLPNWSSLKLENYKKRVMLSFYNFIKMMTPGDLQDSRETLKVQNSSYISKGDKENSESII